MNNSTRKKKEQLGMNPSTASAILKKNLMFHMAQKLELDYCYQCGAKIESAEEFSVEHKEPWMDSNDPVGIFFDVDNIAFSHLLCNISAARRPRIKIHPSIGAYQRGCRCSECREKNKLHQRKKRKKMAHSSSG